LRSFSIASKVLQRLEMSEDHINGIVYVIRFPNGKCYVGITVKSLNVRENGHRCAAKSGKTQIVYNALRKYNLVDKSFCEQVDTAFSLTELYEKEKYRRNRSWCLKTENS
jgi:predicted GIY-YIG superfamily endonuclease